MHSTKGRRKRTFAMLHFHEKSIEIVSNFRQKEERWEVTNILQNSKLAKLRNEPEKQTVKVCQKKFREIGKTKANM